MQRSEGHPQQAKCVDRSYPFFASQKSVKAGFIANSLAQTFALLYEGAGLEGASSHSGRRTFLTNLANKGTAIHILKTLAGPSEDQHPPVQRICLSVVPAKQETPCVPASPSPRRSHGRCWRGIFVRFVISCSSLKCKFKLFN